MKNVLEPLTARTCHRATRLPLVLALAAAISMPALPPASADAGKRAPSTHVPPAAGVKPVNRPVKDKWALVIGVSKFQDPKINLKYPAKDAQDFYNYLVTDGNFTSDHVVLLTDARATRANILSLIGDKWLPRVANPDDLVVIYFSSHGSPADMDVGGVNYLLASDTNTECLYATGIALQDLMQTIKHRVHSDRVVIVLDACHSGAADVASKGLRRAGNIDAAQVVAGTGQLVIASSRPDQASWESKDSQNGVFTKQLIDALKARGDQTRLGEAFRQLQDKVQQQVLLERGQLQTPQMKSQWQGNDLILSVPPAQPHMGIPIESLNLLTPAQGVGVAGPGAGITPGAPAPVAPVTTVVLPPKTILDNGNIYRVFNRPTAATTFELESPALLTYAYTYHWNDGRGTAPGTIAFRHQDGTLYGPFSANGKAGQGGVPNAYWECEPMSEMKPGLYTILDSSPATWSQNSASAGCGFARIKVVPRSVVSAGGGVPATGVRREPVSSIFNNGNIYLVRNKPKAPTSFMLQKPTLLTSICNYHWNDARGQEPGNITLVRQDGTVYGPWRSKGRPGQGGVPNAYWYCDLDVLLKPGLYVVLDSDSGTWSRNPESGEAGITDIKGVVQD